MGHLIALFFKPPPMPPIDLPLPPRMASGVLSIIGKVYETVYFRGVFDGVIAGVLITLMFVPSIKSRALRGAANVVDHIS
jgi:hypothetical protein